MLPLMVSPTGRPSASRAGSNWTRRTSSAHVVESRDADPLEEVIVQEDTRPLLSTWSR